MPPQARPAEFSRNSERQPDNCNRHHNRTNHATSTIPPRFHRVNMLQNSDKVSKNQATQNCSNVYQSNDIAFISNWKNQELQCMLSVTHHHANQSRVTINPSKTKADSLDKLKHINRSVLQWTLGNNSIYPSEDTTHLCLIRAEFKENELNIDASISIARQTLIP
ncbi:unnamed protein product [Mytilus coruscus]|uniref:Uncharacterized protein n=1 Tax=Mytilus coruscus TaxID=42192 RepID=A0A6J8ABG6_MYTCO|nr:unnamed protein product [Mytilus coruscus]